ncbi:alpha/beta hydrolase [Cupriavidus gilardii]|uniref:Alpha/beta hydrolase n=1 Tax=Cupriavidus gilardii TaxID=82541 RepID=A0A849BJB9_9BURK|nr:alpha/beta hydrolase [Cupriavidus gilardii]KAB0599671.1 alpha/beta hydrolase [Cupriavidus gilardii]MCT9013032.1 alpha/beta hydrolase [Cupriavidus gilardii]MCT9052586.1 alpha/beta hydrolase [Cupriavidus gilardii]NNH10719.1 alpha/beta hydrolase [Cupriavidus gilardii]WNG68833.1 alpha/beta hydrolase [Cupriavidus gilardii]
MSVYRNFNQESLDRQYNVRGGIPHYQAIFDRWAKQSAEIRHVHAVSQDLAYGDDAKQTLDFFSARSAARPLLIFIHGGYWQSLDKSDFSYLAIPYLKRDINVAVVNYRLAPTVAMADIVRDNQDAVVWLYRQAQKLGFDADRIFLSGHSAGGHLTATLAGTHWQDFGVPADVLKGGCAISGLYDLEPIRLCYLNKVVGLTEADVAAFSPMRHPPSTRLPMILTVGGDESDEYHRLQADYAALLRQHGVPVEIVDQPSGHHFDAVDALGDARGALAAAVLRMIEAAA